MRKYKRVYVEITKRCNLNCSFCVKENSEQKDLSLSDFKMIADQLPELTSTVYYHILGEPLLHPELDEMLKYAKDLGLKNSLTTNGLLLKDKLGKWSDLNINRLNISLQAYFDKNNQLNSDKAKEIVEVARELQKEIQTVVFFRLWDMDNPDNQQMALWLEETFKTKIDYTQVNKPNGFQLGDWFRLHEGKRFVWPTNALKGTSSGFCEGLRTHFGILSEGTVVPCCLDAYGQIPLGNIHQQTLKEILESPKALEIYNSFSKRQALDPLCIKCEYKSRFD